MNNDNKPHKILFENKLNIKELDQTIKERLDVITDEFKNGIDFITKHPKSVTFFGSARTPENDDDYTQAKNLASRISKELGYTIVTGGGPGIMGAANHGAFEVGGKSVGFTIKLPMEQVTNSYLTDHIDFKYFFSRKVCLTFSAEAFVYFPGGFGTMDELFEILTLVQTNKIEKVPIILFGNNHYWKNLDAFIKENLLKNEKIDPEDVELYTITEDMDVVLDIIKKSPIRLD